MRVGLAMSVLPQAGRKPGGVEIFVDRLADQLVAAGHAVTVFAGVPAPIEARYERTASVPSAIATRGLGRDLVVPLALNLVGTSELDVLHLHGDDWFFVRRRVPTVRTFHGSSLQEARSAKRLRRRLRRTATHYGELVSARLADSSYGVSPHQDVRLARDGALPLGVDVVTEPATDKSDEPTVLFVGTWEGRKRGRLLADVFTEHVLARVPSARLIMVSDHAPDHPSITHLAGVPDSELQQLYRRSWLMCLPSTYEGLGIPYLEAMAMGTPVLATANPGAEYVLDGGEAGLIVDEARLGEAIVLLLSDQAARRHWATRGHRRAEDFAWTKVITAHEDAYELARRRYSSRNNFSKRVATFVQR